MPSLFHGVYQALYDYEARTEDELTFSEGQLLYLLEKSSTDEWLKAKKAGPAGTNETGLVPLTYIEPAPSKRQAYALYDYDKQTEEELTFKEGDPLTVYDDSDSEWLLVCRGGDEYGFVPANYIGDAPPAAAPAPVAAPVAAVAPPAAAPVTKDSPLPPLPKDAFPPPPQAFRPPASTTQASTEPVYANGRDEESPPPMPARPGGGSSRPASGSGAGDSRSRGSSVSRPRNSDKPPASSANFFTWPVQEVDGRKKRKATLAIGNGMIMFSPERSSGQPQQWPVKDLVNYNSEKKHVFLDFKHPTVSFDLHLGSKDTADEVIYALGELAGAYNSSGLTEVMMAANSAGQKLGKVLYKFDAQGRDEVSVEEGENVFIIDDTKSRDWWMVKNSSGVAGVVPSSYIEIAPSEKTLKKVVDQQRKASGGGSSRDKSRDRSRDDRSRDRSDKRSSRSSRDAPKSKPDPRKVRTWTDRSGAFKVDAALLGCVDGKIHLHKVNGVKIAVACSKMAIEDLEYVEDKMGIDLEEDKPLSRDRGSRRRSTSRSDRRKSSSGAASSSHANVPKPTSESDYDWFGFFLDCGVDVHACQRYATSFTRDQMDESILPEVTPSTLRSLGLKEGDILRVTKKLDEKYGRSGTGTSAGTPVGGNPTGGLFSDTTGALKNNTSKTLTKADDTDPWSSLDKQQAPPSAAPVQAAPVQAAPVQQAPVQQAPPPVQQAPIQAQPTAPLQPVRTGSINDLVNIKPLQPTPTSSNLQTQATGGIMQPIQQQFTQQPMSQSTSALPQQTMNTGMLPQTTGPLQQSLTGAAPVQNPFLTGGPNTLLSQQTGGLVGVPTGGLVGVPTGGLQGVPTGYTAQNVLGMNQPMNTGFVQQPMQQQPMMQQPTNTGGYSMNAITNALANASLNKQQQQPMMQQQLTGGSMYGQQQPMQQQLTGGSIFNSQPVQQQFTQQQPMSQQLTGGSIFNSQPVQQPFQQQQQQPFQQQQQPFATGASASPFGSQPTTPFGQPTSPFGQQQQSAGMNYFNNIQPLQQQQAFGQKMQPQQTFAQQPFQQQNTQQPFGQVQQQQPFQQQQQQQPFGGLQSQPTGFGFGNSSFGGGMQSQQTGAPSTSFGQQPLQPTATGRQRANLASATPNNPFGF